MSGCPCDTLEFPPVDAIPPGLDTLPRQRAGFPEFRRHLLSDVHRHPVLAEWRARSGDDFGLMFLEMWAYVLDVTQFYDGRIADESYLRTAQQRTSVRRLTGLIGYRPRPAVGAHATLAVFADGADAVTLPAGTAFRSKAFGQERPQTFELAAETVIHPHLNLWTLAPVRSSVSDGEFWLAPEAPGVAAGQIAVVSWPAGGRLETYIVASVIAEDTLDGNSYRHVRFTETPTAFAGANVADIELFVLSQSAAPASLPIMASATSTTTDPTADNASVALDSQYTQICAGDTIVLDTIGGRVPVIVTSTEIAYMKVAENNSVPVTVPVTRVRWTALSGSITIRRVYFRKIAAGALTRPATTALTPATFSTSLALEAPVEPLTGVTVPGDFLIKGKGDEGARFTGMLAVTAQGQGTIDGVLVTEGAESELRTPLEVFGNVIEVTRGETVTDEVLGSANAAIAFQAFTLRKKPLTYLADVASPDGVSPELAVRVNGILWRRVTSLLAAKPDDQVYVVRQHDDGGSEIMFGDTARPPSGVNNVTATYRFGAGAAGQPAGAISQIARRTERLKSVESPLPARGGADAEPAKDIRKTAPVQALTLGRAVSLDDYRAIAARQPGVVNAAAGWAWEETYQRAVVKIWIINEGGDVAAAVKSFLLGQGDGHTPVSVVTAGAIETDIEIEFEIDGTYNTQTVKDAVRAALVDGETGFLAPANAAIGQPIYRSAIIRRIFGVAGVTSVRSLLINTVPAPVAITVPEGCYLNVTVTVA